MTKMICPNSKTCPHKGKLTVNTNDGRVIAKSGNNIHCEIHDKSNGCEISCPCHIADNTTVYCPSCEVSND
jgi:hypothetical protein